MISTPRTRAAYYCASAKENIYCTPGSTYFNSSAIRRERLRFLPGWNGSKPGREVRSQRWPFIPESLSKSKPSCYHKINILSANKGARNSRAFSCFCTRIAPRGTRTARTTRIVRRDSFRNNQSNWVFAMTN